MRRSFTLHLVVFAMLLTACSSKAPRDNPNDPGSTGPKNPGRITGQIFIQGRSNQDGWQVIIRDELDVAVDGGLVTSDGGNFTSPDLEPGLYDVEVEVPVENVPIEVTDVQVLPAAVTDLGLLTSLGAPEVGRIEGQVILHGEEDEQDISYQGTRVVLTRLTSEVTEVLDTETDAGGMYVFDQLPAGDYELRAAREGYTPALVEWAVDSTRQVDDPPVMELYPASAVIRIAVSGPGGEILGAPFTQSRDVDLVMLAFGGVNEMRFSESPDFLESGVAVAWRDYLAQAPITLSAGEGPKTVYAQFRVMDAERGERLRTETYQTSILYDVSPPVVVSYEVAPNAQVIGGQRYLTDEDPSSVPVRVVAFDPFSRVAGVKLVVEGADPVTVPYDTISTSETTVTWFDTVALTPTDGVKTVALQLLDGAGNESELLPEEVIIDTLPPALFGTDPIEVRGTVGDIITSQIVTLQFFVGADLGTGADGPVRMRFGTFPLPDTGGTISFLPEITMAITAGHGETVQFEARFQDNVGNEVVALSRVYTMNLLGSVRGTAYIEGVPEDEAGHDGTIATVYDAGADPATDPPVLRPNLGNSPAVATTLVDGTYVISDLPSGSYQVQLTRMGAISVLRAPVNVVSGETTELGVDRLVLARGGLHGIFLYGDLAPAANHGGITVVAKQNVGGNYVTLASTATDDTGYYSFAGLPIGSYSLTASSEGYVAVSVPADVEQDEDLPVSPNSDVPPGPTPVSLPKLSGDFKICDENDTAPLSKDCGAILYTSATQVLLGLDADNVTHVRYIQQDPANPGVDSFSNPTDVPTADPCGAPPEEDCWNPYDPATRYLTNVNNHGEGRVTLLVQFAANATLQSVGSATVVYDITAPLSPNVTIQQPVTAPVAGFTNVTELSLELTAVATTGPSSDASPLATVGVSRDNVLDIGNDGDREYAYGGTKLFDVAAGDGTKDVYAWFCDAAGNCNTSPVTDSIILDQTDPTRTNGRDIVPSGPGITLKSLGNREWWARSTGYAVDIDVGTSPWSVPEVVGYRIALSEDFVDSEWVYLDLASVNPGDTVTVNGVALAPVDGEQLVYSQFVDAAGNISVAELALDQFSLFLDTVPPGGTVTIEGGAGYTNRTNLGIELTTDPPPDGATHIQYSWTGVLPPPTAPKDGASCAPPATGCLFANNLTLTPQVDDGSGTLIDDLSDGNKTLLVRFFDAAGNFAERSAFIFVDRTAPSCVEGGGCDPALATASCASCTNDTYFSDVNGEITLALFASDNSGFIAGVRVIVDNDVANPRLLSYAPFQTLTVSLVEGTYPIEVTFIDPAGNETTAPVFNVTLDRSPPSASLRINDNDTWTNDGRVRLTIDGSDSNPISGMYVSNASDFSDAALLPFATSLEWTLALPAADDVKTVYVRVVDAAGNPGSASDTIQLDGTPPTLSPTLTGPAADGTSSTLTRSATVDVEVNGADTGALPSGLSYLEISNFADFSATTYADAYTGTVAHDLCSGVSPCEDGAGHQVFVRVTDLAGNQAESSASITLDRGGPFLSDVELRYAGDTSVTPSVLVDLTLLTNADEIQVTGDITNGFAGDWLPAVELLGVTLNDTLGDGDKSVTVRARDLAGNPSTPASEVATILLDTTPPRTTAAAVTLTGEDKDGPSTTLTRFNTVSVELTDFDDAHSGIVEMRAWETGQSEPDTWIPYASTFSWVLAPGQGLHTLNVKVRDAAGNPSVGVIGTITLDSEPPPAPDFDGAPFFDSGANPNFELGNLQPDCVPAPGPQPPGPPPNELEWFLLEVNWLPATGAVEYLVDASTDAIFTTNLLEVPLWVSDPPTFPPPFDPMLCHFDWYFAPMSPLTTGTSMNLGRIVDVGFYAGPPPYPDQVYWVRVTATDAAGNVGPGAVTTMTFDQTPPTLNVTAPNATNGYVSSVALTLGIETNEQGLMKVINSSAGEIYDDVEAQPIQPLIIHLLEANEVTGNPPSPAPSNEGKTVSVQIIDAAGNEATDSVSVTLDDVPPDPPQMGEASQIIDLNTNVAPGSENQFSISLAVPANDHHLDTYLVTGGTLGTLTQVAAGDFPYTLTLNANQDNRITLRARDLAGNLSIESVISVTEDSTAPDAPSNPQLTSGNGLVALSWDPSPSPDVDGYLIYYGSDPSILNGTQAAQGASPVWVPKVTNTQLTGLANGAIVAVAVAAVDRVYNNTSDPAVRTAHTSSLSDTEVARPMEVSPSIESCIDLDSDYAMSVVLYKGFAFVGQQGGIIRAYDMLDPATPVEVSSLTLANGGHVTEMMASGRWLHVREGNENVPTAQNGVAMIDITMPDLLGTTTTGLEIEEELVSKRYTDGSGYSAAVAALWTDGIQVSIGFNLRPTLGTYRSWVEVWDIDSCQNSNCLLTPDLLSSSRSNVSTSLDYVNQNKLAATFALTGAATGFFYSGTTTGLQVNNHTNIDLPLACYVDSPDGTCPGGFTINGASSSAGVETLGDHVYLAGREALHVFDVNDPYNVVSVASLGFSGQANSSHIEAGSLYAPSGGGLEIVDISTPESPRRVGLQTGGCGNGVLDSDSVYGMGIEANLAVLGGSVSGRGSLRTVYISQPDSVIQVGGNTVEDVSGQSNNQRAAMYKNILVVGGQNTYTTVFDVSNPASIQKTAYFGPSGLPEWRLRDVVFAGPYLVAATSSPSNTFLRVMSFGDPTNPTTEATVTGATAGLTGTYHGRAVAVSDYYAYVAVSDATGTTNQVIPIRLRDAVHHRSGGGAFDSGDVYVGASFTSRDDLPQVLEAHRGYLYGLSSEGLKVMPLAPRPSATDFYVLRDEDDDSTNLAVSGGIPVQLMGYGRLLYGITDRRLYIWDVSDGAVPVLATPARYIYAPYAGLSAAGRYVYTTGNGGMDVLEITRTGDTSVSISTHAHLSGVSGAQFLVNGRYLFTVDPNTVTAYQMR